MPRWLRTSLWEPLLVAGELLALWAAGMGGLGLTPELSHLCVSPRGGGRGSGGGRGDGGGRGGGRGPIPLAAGGRGGRSGGRGSGEEDRPEGDRHPGRGGRGGGRGGLRYAPIGSGRGVGRGSGGRGGGGGGSGGEEERAGGAGGRGGLRMGAKEKELLNQMQADKSKGQASLSNKFDLLAMNEDE